MTENDKKIYTVGHSTHSREYFLELLTVHKIDCLIDVRSIPASAYNPQFNKEVLQIALKKQDIQYMHFAKEFGARHSLPHLLDADGRVDFEKVRQSSDFLAGIGRLEKGLARGYTIALMCAEAEPLDCHRFSLVSMYLAQHEFSVRHILKDKSLKDNTDLETELMKKYAKKLPQPSLLEPNISPKDQLLFAYKLINKEIAYSPNNQKTDGEADDEAHW